MTPSSPTTVADAFLFVGTHGHVLAIDKQDGTEIWRTSLPKTGYRPVLLLYEDGQLLVGTRGKLFALDPLDGSIRWENELTGLGHDLVALATTRQGTRDAELAGGAAEEAARQSDDTTTTTATS